MIEVDNLGTSLRVTLAYFIMTEVSNLLEKIRNLVSIIIRVIGSMTEYFWFLWNIFS